MTNIIAITACPSGVAHTYMAAEALERAARAKGWECKVETQGSIGVENKLTAEDVAAADMVILTKDIGILFEERFAGKVIVRIAVSDAVKRADAIMDKIAAYLEKTPNPCAASDINTVEAAKNQACLETKQVIKSGGGMTIKLVAVTACVSGVAHTYMVAERLDKLCLQLKWQLKVETQGALGVEYSLTEDDILQADAVILINDVAIKEQERFQNCRCVQADIQTFLCHPEKILAATKSHFFPQTVSIVIK